MSSWGLLGGLLGPPGGSWCLLGWAPVAAWGILAPLGSPGALWVTSWGPPGPPRPRPTQTRPDPPSTYTEPPRPAQTHSDPLRPTQICPNPPKPIQTYPDTPRPTQTTRPTQTQPDPPRHTHPPQTHPDPPSDLRDSSFLFHGAPGLFEFSSWSTCPSDVRVFPNSPRGSCN